MGTTLADWLPLVPVTLTFKVSERDPEKLETVRVLVPPGLIDVGLIVQVAGEVAEQVRLMLLVNELGAVAVMVNVFDVASWSAFAEGGFADKEKTATPTPISPTVCDLLAASSVTVRDCEMDPVLAGVKVTVMAQFDPGGMAFGQLFVSVKLVAAEIAVMLSVAVPELVRVTV
jgi:hypothetical protein